MSSVPDSVVPDPYVKTHPGDLITAELFNGVQEKIKADIAKQIDAAIKALKSVDQAGDSGKLGGKTPKELEEEIIKKALAELPKRDRLYQVVFKRLRKNEQVVIKHNFNNLPLVDVYQLDYFEVVCADGDEKEDRENKFVNFYLYNRDEIEQKSAAVPTEKRKIIIEPTDGKHYPYKIPFQRMLDYVGVKPSDSESLGDIVTEFWDAFFAMPNCDQFDPDQFCHSPWFEKCCGENRSYQQLNQRGNWDEIWFQMRPRKTINFPSPPREIAESTVLFPNNVEVVHFDFDKIGVELLQDPFYFTSTDTRRPAPPFDINELKVMLILKA